jgi:hypothetical protein
MLKHLSTDTCVIRCGDNRVHTGSIVAAAYVTAADQMCVLLLFNVCTGEGHLRRCAN